MKISKQYTIKLLVNLMWVVVGSACIALLVSAVRNKEGKICKGVEISISGVSSNFFIDKADVYNIIKNFGGDSAQKRSLVSIDLGRIEKALEKDVWVKNAELYFDNNNFLKVSVEEREPIARLFTVTGNTFYIDSSCMILPLSEKFSARLPVFTGFTSDAKILAKNDSALLRSIKNMSLKILADTFLMAMIDQIDINTNRSFELIPKLGKQRIIFGDATEVDTKFDKLKLFYKDVITQSGWNMYSTISLQYKNQVVAGIRGKEDIKADSLRTMQLIKLIAEDAARRSADSSQVFLPETDRRDADSSLIQQSMERENEGASNQIIPPIITPASAIMLKTAPTKVGKPSVPTPAEVIPKSNSVTANKPPAVVTKPKPKPVNKSVVVINKTISKQIKNPAVVMPAKPAIKKPVVQSKPNNEYDY
jgi:cell division protein FtsQ